VTAHPEHKRRWTTADDTNERPDEAKRLRMDEENENTTDRGSIDESSSDFVDISWTTIVAAAAAVATVALWGLLRARRK